ncbi:KTSC domain-containing protein [Cryobacterium frigoriphilum]|uniref:KTSC domain-containing protein n=1 Tax=Cryobacterium frigoriphilum TaxID=1259150 RepID=A0A4R8ZTC1_9MICO|nr:KTSC domain-containing protein [Cryobacterium frigoriphilum]
MTFEWQPVASTRIVAEGYDPNAETIYVEFPTGGVQWWYGACPADVWEQFTAPGQSRGQFIHQILDAKPNGRYA